MRAICGLKEPATSERRSAVLLFEILSVLELVFGEMKPISRSEDRYCVLLVDMSDSV